jgi:hypothetical protein
MPSQEDMILSVYFAKEKSGKLKPLVKHNGKNCAD